MQVTLYKSLNNELYTTQVKRKNTVIHKKHGRSFVIITLENLDGFQ